MAADLSAVEKWVRQDPSRKLSCKPLWITGVQAAMRAAMGERFFALSQKQRTFLMRRWQERKGIFAVWSCNEADDCGGNNMTCFLICRGTVRSAGVLRWCRWQVQDFWLPTATRPATLEWLRRWRKNPFVPLKNLAVKIRSRVSS